MIEDWLEEIKDCIRTPEQTEAQLLNIERQLGERLSLIGNIREQLITLDKANLLVEDELIADWHCTYASYVNDRKYLSETGDCQD